MVQTLQPDLLAHGMGIHAIRRDGADVAQPKFDRIVKRAASEVAAKLICASLHIKADEERQSFGFAA